MKVSAGGPSDFGIGQPVRRKEDFRLLTGRGRYSDDYSLPGQVYAAILRSPHAHARVASVDASGARAMPGVLGVFTGADVAADRLKQISPAHAEAPGPAFSRAAHVVRLETWISRVTGAPMEPRACLGSYDAATGRYTLYAGSGGSNRMKRESADILGVPQEAVRVLAHDIGGNFGTKNSLYPEFVLVLWASRKIGRPVKWTCERSEAFVSDYQGRDLVVKAELALDRDGRFLALRSTNLSNLGAHAASIIPLRKGVSILNGLYRVPVCHYRAQAVLSNTPSTIPYRSAGRPEAMIRNG